MARPGARCGTAQLGAVQKEAVKVMHKEKLETNEEAQAWLDGCVAECNLCEQSAVNAVEVAGTDLGTRRRIALCAHCTIVVRLVDQSAEVVIRP